MAQNILNDVNVFFGGIQKKVWTNEHFVNAGGYDFISLLLGFIRESMPYVDYMALNPSSTKLFTFSVFTPLTTSVPSFR